MERSLVRLGWYVVGLRVVDPSVVVAGVGNLVGPDLSVSGVVDANSSGSGTSVSHSRNSCSTAPIVGETVDVNLSVGRGVVGKPFTDGSVGTKLFVSGTVNANSPVGGIVGADWENIILMGKSLNHTAINYNMEEVRIWDLLLESRDKGE